MPQKDAPGIESGGPAIIKGEGADIVSIRREGDVTIFSIECEVAVEVASAAAIEAFTAGYIGPATALLVDLTKFVGSVDWPAIHSVRDKWVWNPPAKILSRTAYLVRDEGFAPIVKLSAALFPTSDHRLFTDRNAALAWLNAPEGETGPTEG